MNKKKNVLEKRDKMTWFCLSAAQGTLVSLKQGCASWLARPKKSISSKLITFLLVWHPDNPRPARVFWGRACHLSHLTCPPPHLSLQRRLTNTKLSLSLPLDLYHKHHSLL